MNLDANGAANPNFSKNRQQRSSKKDGTALFTEDEKKKLAKEGGVPYTGELFCSRRVRLRESHAQLVVQRAATVLLTGR